MGKFSFEGVLSAAARDRIAASDTTEMNDLISEHGAMSFCAGDPGSYISPRDAIREAFASALASSDVWCYENDPFGDIHLREWIARLMHDEDTAPRWAGPEHIMLTNGGSEAMNFVAEALIDPGSIVLVEGPTYNEALMTFRRHGAVCLDVPTDEHGIIPEALESIRGASRARFIYTIPNFQNPTGRTASRERRLAVLDFARRRGIAILEDDPYRALAFDGAPPQSYLALAGDDSRVIYTSSFSKIVSTAIRAAWLVLPPDLAATFGAMRMSQGICLSPIAMRAAFNYLSSIEWPDRTACVGDEFRSRCDCAIRAAAELIAPMGFHVERPEGGMFLWFEADESVPDPFSSDAFARHAVASERVGILPGTVFYPANSGRGRRAFRISTAKTPTDVIGEGFRRLSCALRSYL